MGIETLIAEELLTAPQLEAFLVDLLWESGKLEAIFARQAYRFELLERDADAISQWLLLNRTIAAAKGARESRNASAMLGRRFLQSVAHLEAALPLQGFYQAAMTASVDIHYCAAFGLVGRHLILGEDETILAYLQQSVMALVSAALRLLPIGQGRASEILWRLKPVITMVAEASDCALSAVSMAENLAPSPYPANVSTFTPLVDLGSMRHPTLRTRLFIS
ncbi:MAG: urease accessory UreF family protein [Caldilineaceae bacterium]